MSKPDDLAPKTASVIAFKARMLARSPGFLLRDEEDLRQELSLQVVLRRPAHDPSRSSERTFAQRVLASKVTDLVRRARAQRRDRCRERSFNDLPPRTIEELRERSPELAEAEVRHDVNAVLSKLPHHDRQIALALAEHTVAEVARQTGLSRQNVRTVRARVRRQFEESGVAA